MRQPLADSEEVLRLRTRLQESDKMLQSAEQQINELETRSESWRQEVPGSLFLNVVSYMVPSDLSVWLSVWLSVCDCLTVNKNKNKKIA